MLKNLNFKQKVKEIMSDKNFNTIFIYFEYKNQNEIGINDMREQIIEYFKLC
jgi:hypothetical protein